MNVKRLALGSLLAVAVDSVATRLRSATYAGLGRTFTPTPDRFKHRLDVSSVDAQALNFVCPVGEPC